MTAWSRQFESAVRARGGRHVEPEIALWLRREGLDPVTAAEEYLRQERGVRPFEPSAPPPRARSHHFAVNPEPWSWANLSEGDHVQTPEGKRGLVGLVGFTERQTRAGERIRPGTVLVFLEDGAVEDWDARLLRQIAPATRASYLEVLRLHDEGVRELRRNQEEPERCAVCEGELVYLGQLGTRLHFRCRHCGMEQSRTEEEDLVAPIERNGRSR